MDQELSYWLALLHSPRIKTKKKHEIIVRLFEQGKTIIDFFHSDSNAWGKEYDLTDVESRLEAVEYKRTDIPFSRMAEALGYTFQIALSLSNQCGSQALGWEDPLPHRHACFQEKGCRDHAGK